MPLSDGQAKPARRLGPGERAYMLGGTSMFPTLPLGSSDEATQQKRTNQDHITCGSFEGSNLGRTRKIRCSNPVHSTVSTVDNIDF